jgi:uncharacterized protein YgiM (DUF1202 family)
MKRWLLSFWLGGAVLYVGSTLLLTDAVNFQRVDPFRSPPNSALPQSARTAPLSGSPDQAEPMTVTRSEEATANRAKSTQRYATSRGQPSSEEATPTLGLESEDVSSGVSASAQAPEETQSPPNPLPNATETLSVASAASIRKGPSVSHSIVGTLQPGAEIQVLTRESGWVQFIERASGETGWVYSKFLVSDAVTDSDTAEAQLATDKALEAKPKQKSKGTAQVWSRRTPKQPSRAGYHSTASPSVTRDRTASTGRPPRKQLVQEGPRNPELGRQPKSTAQTAEEEVTQEASQPTELPSRRSASDDYSELPPDAEFFPPRQWRFGIFARRRMLRDGIAPRLEEELPPPRYE